jgi:hypothetical protein
MLKLPGTCSPEQLHTLQRIFDLIWMELRASSTSSYTVSSHQDTLREEVARRVLDRWYRDETSPDEIIQQVLASFGKGAQSKENENTHRRTGAQ